MAEQVIDPRLKPLDEVELSKRRDEARANRLPWERDWWLNLCYAQSESNVEFVLDTGKIVTRAIEEGQDHTVYNAILPIIRLERAKLHKTGVTPVVLPSRDNDDAISAARVSQGYLSAEMRRWNFPRKFRQSTFWLVTCGNVFFKWGWEGGPKNKDSGGTCDILSPFEVYWDPYAKTFDSARWVIHERFMSTEEAWELYADLKGADMSVIGTDTLEALSSLDQRVYSDIGTNAGNLDGTVVREYFERPSKAKPEGEFIIHTSKGILYAATTYPYPHGKLPITAAGHIERTSSKYSASVVDFLREPHDALKKREALITENMYVSAAGKWVYHEASDLEHDPTAMPRQNLVARGDLNVPMPTYVQPQPLPNWIVQDTQRIETQMREIAGQHEVSRGGVPGRVDSASGIQLLQETDDAVSKDPIHSLEEAIAEGLTMTLTNAKKYAPANILARDYDTNGLVEVVAFKRSVIDLDCLVNVKITTSLPTTIAGKFDRVLNLVQYNIVTPPQALRLLELSVDNPDIDPGGIGRRQQHSENLLMMQLVTTADGQVAPPHAEEWNDHDSHIDELKKFMNGDVYADLPPDVQDQYIYHLHSHKVLAEAEAAYQGRLQAIAQGNLQAVQPMATASNPVDMELPPEGAPPEGSGGAPSPVAPANPATPDGAGPPEVTDAVPQ